MVYLPAAHVAAKW